MTTFSNSQSPSDNYQYWLDPNHILAGTRQKQKVYKVSLKESWWELTFEVTRYKSSSPFLWYLPGRQPGDLYSGIGNVIPNYSSQTELQTSTVSMCSCSPRSCAGPQSHKCLPQVRMADKGRDTGGDCLVARIVVTQVQYLQSTIRSQFAFFS